MENQRDFQLDQADTFSVVPEPPPDSEIRDVVIAFAANIERVREAAALPVTIAAVAALFQHAFDHACLKVLGKLGLAVADQWLGQDVDAATMEFFSHPELFVGAEKMPELGHATVKELLAKSPDLIQTGLDGVLSGQIVGAWTAFETLASDLWETALNVRPRFGFMALNAEPSPDDSLDEKERKRREKIELPLWLLRDWNYDLKSRMGTLLQRVSKWDFARRDRVKDAYRKAFGRPADARIKTIFDDQSLQWLAATRNAIVHNAGKADSDFTKLVGGHPQLSQFHEGQMILLDGALARDLTNAVVHRGWELIRLVDEKLAEVQVDG